MRRAAQVLREAGVYAGDLCAWTNRWARPPVGTPPARSTQAETAMSVRGAPSNRHSCRS